MIDRHVAEDHLPDWMLAKARAGNVVRAASPYVTDDRLFQDRKGCRARLYLDFSAMHFMSGASSLAVLKKFLARKVELYHMESLHAKVTLIDDTWFSVGSQNLTLGGRHKNVEASFVSGTNTSSAQVQTFFKRIHRSARRISRDDIASMEEQVTPWLKKFESLQSTALKIDKALDSSRQKNEAEERAKQRASAQRKRLRMARRRLVRFMSEQKTAPQNCLIAVVKTLYNRQLDWLGLGKGSRDSLVPADSRRGFDSLFSGLSIFPRRLNRYLVVNEDTGKLGFVRVGKTCWTFFASGVSFSKCVRFLQHELKLEIEFDWKLEAGSSRNGEATLRAPGDPKNSPVVAKVDFVFSPTGIELGDIQFTVPSGELATLFAAVPKSGTSARAELKDIIFERLTEPFVYNDKLLGCEAASFLGPRSRHVVSLHRLGKHAIFSVKQEP